MVVFRQNFHGTNAEIGLDGLRKLLKNDNEGEPMRIRIIITGGTFDKHYDEIQGTLTFKDTHLPEILEQVRCTLEVKMELNQLIDSLEMGRDDRLQILEACKKATERRIVITHGTDTMTETARVLGEAGLDKVIVLTGAMIPYTLRNSDAVFNLGCSLMAVQLLPAGVYITMNGKVFAWDNVKKERERGVFTTKD
jgi:L-asparaginase